MDDRELYRLWKCNIDLTDRIKQKIHANDILRKFNKEMLLEAKQETTSINKEKD